VRIIEIAIEIEIGVVLFLKNFILTRTTPARVQNEIHIKVLNTGRRFRFSES